MKFDVYRHRDDAGAKQTEQGDGIFEAIAQIDDDAFTRLYSRGDQAGVKLSGPDLKFPVGRLPQAAPDCGRVASMHRGVGEKAENIYSHCLLAELANVISCACAVSPWIFS
jgi:hypothetical protein